MPSFTRSVAPARRLPQTVVITGGASGIGAASARECARRGHQVAICDLNVAAAEALCEELGRGAAAFELDVRSPDDWKRVWGDVAERYGSVDVLVNNAGIIHTGFARDLSFDQHRDMVDVNYFGVLYGVLTALPIMREQGRGHIINIASMGSFMPLTGYSTYGATKHAIRAFHHAMVMEERGGPVRFSIIHPPAVQTPMLDQEKLDPSAVLAFAEKAAAPEDIGRSINDAIDTVPLEVVFPRFSGRFQRLAGSNPRLMHTIIPAVEKYSALRLRLQRRS